MGIDFDGRDDLDLQKYQKLSDIEFNNLADVARKVIGMIKEQEKEKKMEVQTSICPLGAMGGARNQSLPPNRKYVSRHEIQSWLLKVPKAVEVAKKKLRVFRSKLTSTTFDALHEIWQEQKNEIF
ncbi:hypothetical protein CAEBREN_06699 [Caenorhabditis brenneri]|uniref:Uncharacterized protein n=1 Tax=Caenorhabditis brenneri TaxID=135651 RepID=G0MW17_CAEBE|nr:hypothetical protein CAEBREN_06699 [Caenorhabditis brenneri]